MNAPDTKTPAVELIGTNIPEFHAELNKAIDELATHPDVPLTIWRDKVNRRDFVTFPANIKPPSDVEKIVTLRAAGGGKRFLNADDTRKGALRSAVVNALGYHWHRCAAVQKIDSGEIGWSVDRGLGKGKFQTLATATPHPAGFSR